MQTVKMDQKFDEKFKVISVFTPPEEKSQMDIKDSAVKIKQDFDAIQLSERTKNLRCVTQLMKSSKTNPNISYVSK